MAGSRQVTPGRRRENRSSLGMMLENTDGTNQNVRGQRGLPGCETDRLGEGLSLGFLFQFGKKISDSLGMRSGFLQLGILPERPANPTQGLNRILPANR